MSLLHCYLLTMLWNF